MSVFNVLPSGVNTFFPTFWKHPDALFKKGVWLAAYPLPDSLDDGVPSAEIHHRSDNSMGKSVSQGPVCLSDVSVSERAESAWRMNRMIVGQRRRHPDCPGVDTPPTTSLFFEKGIRMLPERLKKCVDSGGEYVED